MNKTRKLISLVLVLMLVFSCTTVIPAAAAQTNSAAGVPGPGCGILKFNNTLKWENVFMYAWNEAGDVSAQWPGEQLSPEFTDDDGCEVYYLNIPYGSTGIIINDGWGVQTDDITDFYPTGDGYYLDADRTTVNGNGALVYVPIPLDETFNIIIGDADGNKTINISDVTAVQKYLADNPVPKSFNAFAADANQDNVISIEDATLIQLYLAGIERENNRCNTMKSIKPYSDKKIYSLDFCDLLDWGKVSVIARDKNGNRLPANVVEGSDSESLIQIPSKTASLTIVSEDGTKRTVPCTDSMVLSLGFGMLYVSYDKGNSRYVVNCELYEPTGLIAEFEFVNSLGWDKVVMEEWDEYGNLVKSTELTGEGDRFTVNPKFYARKVTMSDGNGHRTDYITGFYTIPGQADVYSPDEGKTTVNDMGETVYVLKKIAYAQGSSFTFSNSLGWDEIFVYAWDKNGEAVTTNWPGNKLTDCFINDYGQEVYTVNVPANAAGVILSDGNGNQTDNITDFSHSGYYLDGSTTVNDFGATVYTPIPFPDE